MFGSVINTKGNLCTDFNFYPSPLHSLSWNYYKEKAWIKSIFSLQLSLNIRVDWILPYFCFILTLTLLISVFSCVFLFLITLLISHYSWSTFLWLPVSVESTLTVAHLETISEKFWLNRTEACTNIIIYNIMIHLICNSRQFCSISYY